MSIVSLIRIGNFERGPKPPPFFFFFYVTEQFVAETDVHAP